jgi:hypothetical protein
MRIPSRTIFVATAILYAGHGLPALATCADIEPPGTSRSLPVRSLEPEDLLRLRDLGPDFPEGPIFAVSPDGRHFAFQLRQADPDSNDYCLAMFVAEARPGAVPRMVDQGGELIRLRLDFRERAGLPTGIPITITPHWSPDGTWIAFLKRDGPTVQVWRAFADGSGSAPITHSDVDVESFRISRDGAQIIYTARPAFRDAQLAIEREGLSGFHYDDRYTPNASSRPFVPLPIETVTFIHDIASDQATLISTERSSDHIGVPNLAQVPAVATSASGRRAWLRPSPDEAYPPRIQLLAEDPSGRLIPCTFESCREGVIQPWWADDEHLRYLAREGWASASIGIYEWSLRDGEARRLYSTDDVLTGCAPAADRLLCVHETSTSPRRFIFLDPVSGQHETVLDPNPEFSSFTLGHVERLRWSNDVGIETIGDLVLPVNYRPGTRYPLIVVQYDTRGFLRGGTGNDYPIQVFANRGYAILSFSRPVDVALRANPRNIIEFSRTNLAGFADRYSVLSSLEVGVHLLVERGIADPDRIGLTGMSDGATTGAFALLHSRTFSVMAMSHCCFEANLPIRVGPVTARHFASVGYPRLTDDNDAFWSQLSVARNARRITTPILLQISDDEYLSALESYTALREVGAPVDMFVFPGEHHVKWQPAHRLAMYRRSLDWFDFWFGTGERAREGRPSEAAHWEALRLENDRRASE